MKMVVEKTAAKDGSANITIQKKGKCRLYYRLGMRYALKSLKRDAADYGFAVERKVVVAPLVFAPEPSR